MSFLCLKVSILYSWPSPVWSNRNFCQYTRSHWSHWSPQRKNDSYPVSNFLVSQILELSFIIYLIFILPQTYTHIIMFYARSWQTTVRGSNRAGHLVLYGPWAKNRFCILKWLYVNGYISTGTNIMSLNLPPGPQSLRYLLSGLSSKVADPTVDAIISKT